MHHLSPTRRSSVPPAVPHRTASAEATPAEPIGPVAEIASYRARSDTRERLLEAAVQLFGDRGFAATTMRDLAAAVGIKAPAIRSEEHTSELQSLMRISYAVFCLKKNKNQH